MLICILSDDNQSNMVVIHDCLSNHEIIHSSVHMDTKCDSLRRHLSFAMPFMAPSITTIRSTRQVGYVYKYVKEHFTEKIGTLLTCTNSKPS